MNNKTEENKKLILGLQLICDCESSKPLDEMNCDLIDACVSLLLDLQDKKVTLTQEQIKEKVSMIPFEEISEFKNNEETPKRRKVLKKNKVLFIAAIISILITLLAVVSVAFEWNIFEELKNRFGSVANTPVNEEIVVDGFTVVVNGEYRAYDNIEQALRKECFSVLYPTNLPEGIEITSITFYNQNGIGKVSYIFSDDKLASQITYNKGIDDSIVETTTEIIYINRLTCYVCSKYDVEWHQIYFEYNGNLYLLSGNDKQELIEIIENLKELE